jgi:hypothetical protein
MLAAVLFVFSVQATFWARGYQTNPAEIKSWWSDATDPERLKLLRSEQKWYAAGFRMWANRARATYNVALLCLLAALTVLAVPPESYGHGTAPRWLAVAVGGVAFLTEVIWITGSSSKSRRMARLLQPQPDETSDGFSADSGP